MLVHVWAVSYCVRVESMVGSEVSCQGSTSSAVNFSSAKLTCLKRLSTIRRCGGSEPWFQPSNHKGHYTGRLIYSKAKQTNKNLAKTRSILTVLVEQDSGAESPREVEDMLPLLNRVSEPSLGFCQEEILSAWSPLSLFILAVALLQAYYCTPSL